MAKAKTPPAGDDDEAPFDEAQLKIITDTVNAAVTGQLGRKLPAQIQAVITPMFDELAERIAPKAGTQPPPAAGQPAAPAAGAQPSPSPAFDVTKHPDFISLQTQVAKMNADRAKETLEAMNAQRDTKLRELLTTAGVEPMRMNGAIAVLREGVKPGATAGEFVRKVKRDGFDEEIAIDAAAKEWIATDEGKSYLAPRKGPTPPATQQRSTAATVVNAPAARGGTANANARQAETVQKKEQAANNLVGAVNELFGGGNIDLT